MSYRPFLAVALAASLIACQSTNKSGSAVPDANSKAAIPASVLQAAALPANEQVVKGMVMDLEVLAKGSGCKALLEVDGGTIEVVTHDIHAQGVLQTALLKNAPVLVQFRKRGGDLREMVRVKLNSKDLYFRK